MPRFAKASAVELEALVGRDLNLTRKGRVMRGCCPFHDEKTPSFKVENARKAWKCFGCGAGGDAIAWMTEYHRMTFAEAVVYLTGKSAAAPAATQTKMKTRRKRT